MTPDPRTQSRLAKVVPRLFGDADQVGTEHVVEFRLSAWRVSVHHYPQVSVVGRAISVIRNRRILSSCHSDPPSDLLDLPERSGGVVVDHVHPWVHGLESVED